MESSFEFYIHNAAGKVRCKIQPTEEVYKVHLNDDYVGDLYYDHHGNWYQATGSPLPNETILAIGDGIDSYLLSH